MIFVEIFLQVRLESIDGRFAGPVAFRVFRELETELPSFIARLCFPEVEAVKLVRERGVSVAQAGRDLGVHENVFRKWVKEFGSGPAQAFPGQRSSRRSNGRAVRSPNRRPSETS